MITSINWLLFHLAIADLLVALFFIPPCILSHFIEEPSGVIGNLLYKFIFDGSLGWASSSASSFLLVAIAYECYNATLRPFEKLGRRRSPWLLPFLWIVANLLIMPDLVVSAYDAESQGCIQNYLDYAAELAYSLAWGVFHLQKFRKISIGNSGNFRLGKERSICHKSHSFTSPSPSLHQKTRCVGKLFCYFLERVFVRRFPVKQMLIIGMCGYEKSGICMFPSF